MARRRRFGVSLATKKYCILIRISISIVQSLRINCREVRSNACLLTKDFKKFNFYGPV